MENFKYKGIIFDLDGTLLDTIEDITDGLNKAAISCGIEPYTIEEAKYLVGSGVDVLINNCLNARSASQNLFDKLKENYMKFYGECKANKTKPYEGIVEALEFFKKNNIKIAVFSNKPDCDTQGVINNYFGKDYFDMVVGKRDGVEIKPSKEGATPILENFRLDLSEILYVGDTKVDMKTAINIGLDSVGVLWGFRKIDELLENGAKYIIDNPLDLIKIVEKGEL